MRHEFPQLDQRTRPVKAAPSAGGSGASVQRWWVSHHRAIEFPCGTGCLGDPEYPARICPATREWVGNGYETVSSDGRTVCAAELADALVRPHLW